RRAQAAAGGLRPQPGLRAQRPLQRRRLAEPRVPDDAQHGLGGGAPGAAPGRAAGTSEAFAAGEVNLAHVGVITRSAEQVGCDALRDAEPILLEAARWLDARQLRYVTPRSGTASTRTAVSKTPTATRKHVGGCEQPVA